MINQKYVSQQPLPPGGQRVYLNPRERGALWSSALAAGACSLAMLAIAIAPATWGIPPWYILVVGLALSIPAGGSLLRLRLAVADLRAGSAVVQTARLDGLRRETALGLERCYAAFGAAGEFAIDPQAFRRLRGRAGRQYRIVYGPASRILFGIEPAR